MQATALLRYGRIAPRKLRVVARMVQGKSVDEAINALVFCDKGAASVIKKLLISAIANAENNQRGSVDTDNLVVRSINVDQGPTLKRWRPRAMGRATRINKRTSHVRIVVDDELG